MFTLVHWDSFSADLGSPLDIACHLLILCPRSCFMYLFSSIFHGAATASSVDCSLSGIS